MEFKSIIKAHDLNLWQFIYPKRNSHWQYQGPIFIGNIKTQFSLTTLKPNLHWQCQKTQFPLAISKPQFSLALLYQKEKEPKIINAWQRKNIMVKYYRCKENHGNRLIRKNSLGVILRTMFLYYKLMKYMDIICIMTSIIYTFNTRGKTFEPTSSSFKLRCDY